MLFLHDSSAKGIRGAEVLQREKNRYVGSVMGRRERERKFDGGGGKSRG